MGTRGEWAHQFVTTIGGQWTGDALAVMMAWIVFEFGDSVPIPFAYNAQATTYVMSGSTPGNSVGVQNYPDWATGMAATVATVGAGAYGYPAIVQAFQLGLAAGVIAQAVDASSWGSHPGQTLGGVLGRVDSLAALDVGAGAPGAPMPPAGGPPTGGGPAPPPPPVKGVTCTPPFTL